MNERKNYEIPCQLLPVTEFDASKGIPPEQLAKIPVGGFVRDEVLLEAVEFDCSAEGPRSDLNCLFDLHEQAWQSMSAARESAAAQPVAARGVDVIQWLTQPELWMVIGAAALGTLPTVFKSVFSLLWHDVWGKEYILAADVHEQNKEMIEKFEQLMEQHRRLRKQNAALQAQASEMIARLRDLPDAAAQRTIALLVRDLGWKKSKAAPGVRFVSQSAAGKPAV